MGSELYGLLTMKFFSENSLTLHVDWLKQKVLPKKDATGPAQSAECLTAEWEVKGVDPRAGPILGFSLVTESEP